MQRSGALVTYGLVTAALAAAVLLRWLVGPFLGDALPFVTLFGAVAIGVWAGGWQPAVFAAILGYIAAAILFIPGGLSLAGFNGVIGLAAYLFTCALIIALGQSMRTARATANEQRETLQVTFRSIGDAVITTGTDFRITYLNGVAEALTGWSEHAAIGQHIDSVFRIVNESTRLPVDNPAVRAVREGIVMGLANHTILLRKDGGELPIDDSAAPIKDAHGTVKGCVLIFRDVTMQRRMEQDRARELLTARVLASIVENSDDAIISKSLDGTIQSWNAAAERLFGYPAEHAVGRHISLVIPSDRLSEEDRIIASIKAGQQVDHFETERIRSDGRRLWVSLTISPVKDDAGNVVGASKIARDITSQREAEVRERQLLDEAAKFVTLVENSTDFIGICDVQGVPFFVNRAGLELVGLDSIDAARPLHVSDFFFPEDQQRVMEEFFPQVLATGHGELEVRFRHFKTGQARWMVYKVLALADQTGQRIGFATVSQDITERKRMEDSLRSLAADLSRADQRKNEFLAMLAHELRNPLAPISNATQALRLAVGDERLVRSATDMLDRQVGQMSRLVDDLLDMSRITRGKIELRRQRVELTPIINHSVEAVRALYRNLDRELTVSTPPHPMFLDGDPARLAQVVGNLLNNAFKFTDPGGRISLVVEHEGDQAVIRVTDNGIGIPPDQLLHVFEMFAQIDTSLERSRDGLGIGLTLVKTIVEMHEGSIQARSEGPGCGSAFTVRLPVLVEAAASVEPAPLAHALTGRGRRVLIVDDNPDGAESLAMLLELHGHQTYKAHDGFEALNAVERLRPDAVLLDIGLPNLDGYQVCQRIRQEFWGRDLLLIALTGWGQQEDRQRSREAGFNNHLVKPVDPNALLSLLTDRLPGAIASSL